MRNLLLCSAVTAAILTCAISVHAEEGRPEQGGRPAASSEPHPAAGTGHQAPSGAEHAGEHQKSPARADAETSKPAAKTAEGEQRPRPAAQAGKTSESKDRAEAQDHRPETAKGARTTPSADENHAARDDAKHPAAGQSGREPASKERAGSTTKTKDETAASGRDNRDHAAKTPDIDGQKEARIRDTIHDQHVQNVSDVDFNVRVGRSVPGRYHFYPLPEDIISLVPEYRGYDYLVADDDIVIVEPGTHRIVYTIPETGTGRSVSTGCR